tara:strand:- start:1785 stop:2135 length:351 start_codon:yes stop_codon:yes gene_type:complete
VKESEKNTWDTGLGICSVLQRADQEIEKLKKASLNPKSKYWKPTKKADKNTSKVGISNSYQFSESNLRGTYDEWLRAYEYFCNQTVNTKGQKVNRQKMKDYAIIFKKGISFGKGIK